MTPDRSIFLLKPFRIMPDFSRTQPNAYRGAQIYAIIRSVTDTCINNGQNVLLAFHTIAKLHPE